MTLDGLDAVWWSACVGCALYGVLVTVVVYSIVVLAVRARDKSTRRQTRTPGGL